ncbi:LamG-like jellyroll fold domain-containing protein [Actinosynnema sp. CA-248983]
MRDGDKQFTLSWPTPLPTPVVNGPTSVYPEVFPGVDLHLTADSTGYSEVLVVKDAKAAANPQLSSLRLSAAATDLDLTTAGDVLSAKDDTGRVVFQGSTPVMWDSTKDIRRGPAPSATDPGSGKVSPLDMSVVAVDGGRTTTAEITITPDADSLRGKDVEYPVYIDPAMSRGRDGWAEVTSSGWSYWNATMDAQVGLCSGWVGCGGSWVARSFFRFTAYELRERNGREPTLYSAEVHALQKHGTSCSDEEAVSLFQTEAFNEGTRWPGPDGGAVDTKTSKAGDQCGGAGYVKFNAWSPVSGIIQHNWEYIHVGLLSPNEKDPYEWKKFDNNVVLEVVFSFPPNPAHGLGVAGAVTCGGKTITPSATPTLYATATDNNDPALNLGLYYEVFDSSSRLRANSGSVPTIIASGTTGQWPTNNRLANGDYHYHVAVQNRFPGDDSRNQWAGPWSAWYNFTARPDPINAVPTITSTDYPATFWGKPQNQPGTFTFDAKGAANIVGFTYTFTGSGTETVPTTTDCDYNRTFGTTGGWVANNGGKATITLPATMSPGYHTLHVRSFDDAHKLSPESQAYTFYVAPSYIAPAPTLRVEAETTTPTGTIPGTVTTDPVASGGKYVTATTTTSGGTDRITFPFTVPTTGYYNVDAGLIDSTTLPDSAEFELDGRWVHTMFSPTATQPATVDRQLAGVHLTAGQHTLSIKITKKTGSTATAFKVGIDYIDLSPTVKLDFETLTVSAQDKPLSHFGGAPWNSSAMKRFDADNTDQSISFKVTTPIEADYAIGLGIVKNSNRGKFTVSVDDTIIGRTDTNPVDGYDPLMINAYVGIGGAHLTAGEHTITFRTVDPNPASTTPKHLIALDYLTLQPINNVTTASFTDAMNNKGIANDGVTTAGIGGAGYALSAQTLAAAGLAPGKTVAINGAAFTMPAAHSTTGNDNVIAIGQTIPFPAAQQIKANSVGLLALSTCGASRPRFGTITYTDGTSSRPWFPEVGDWVNPIPQNHTGIKLPYRNYLLGKEPQFQPVIHPIFVPADPTKTVKSITLPNYGSALLDHTCGPELHILSIAPRPVDAGWVGTWAAPADAAVVPPGGHAFGNKTLRTVLRPTVTGGQARVKLSNALNNAPITIGAATIAAQTGTDSATGTQTTLKFNNNATVTLPAGGEIHSDPVAFPTGGNGNLVVSIHLPNPTALAPVHGNATAPTYLASGNTVTNTDGTPYTTTLTGSYFITGVDVSTPDTSHGTVVILGDHLTATAPPGSTQRNTWVDELPAKLTDVGAPLPGGLVNASRAGIPDTARWRLNDNTGTTARDTIGTHHATLNGGTTWNTDRGGSTTLNGTTAYLHTAGKVLDTSKSFTVSAWLKPNSNGWQTAITQEGTQYNAFHLGYDGDAKRWNFTTLSADNNNYTFVRTHSAAEPALNTWAHLTATYDHTTATMRLYVNGTLEATATGATVFPATGRLVIGRGKHAGTYMHNYNGSISDVRVHQRTLSPAEVTQTHRGQTAGDPHLGTLSAANATSAHHRTALSSPNVRTVFVALGAADILQGKTTEDIRANLGALIKSGSHDGLKQHLRTDGTPLRVVLMTVPPLGLDANDPREVERRRLNRDLLTNYTNYEAGYLLDIDAAVRDSATPNHVAPQYLTDGKPDGDYHNQVAQFVADAINDFPPRAVL